MKSRGVMHATLLLLALINMVPAIEAEDSWIIMSIAVACAITSWLITVPAGGTRVPPRLILTAVGAAVVFLFWEMFGQHEELTVYIIDIGHFMIFLCCCKFFELRTNRDAGLIILISFLLLIIGGFVSASVLFAIAVAVDVTAGVIWMLMFQTVNESAAIRKRQLDALGFGPPAGADEMAAMRRGFILSSLLCTLGILAVALISFVVVPRGWGRGFFGRMHRIVPTAVTGFSDEIELRDTAIFEDPTPIMRVQFVQDSEVLGGEGFAPYMRGQTFDRYVEGRWQPTHSFTISRLQLTRAMSVSPLPNGEKLYRTGSIVEQFVELQESPRGTIFAMYPAVYFGSANIPFIRQDPIDLTLSSAPSGKPITYVVYSLRGENTSELTLLEVPPRPFDIRRPESASTITPRVKDFARKLVARIRDREQSMNREQLCHEIEKYLRKDNFEYTLSRGKAPFGVDPVEDFLTSNRRGHCEYFASAMAVLCQALDIPARIVNGYYAGEFDHQTGAYLFRQKDAHTWVEVYIPNRGWLTFDPTPDEDERVATKTEGFWAKAQHLLDVFRFKWSSAVVSFDAERRFDILAHFKNWYRNMFEGQDRPIRAILKSILWGPEVLHPWERGLYWVLLALCLSFALLFVRLLWILSMMVRARFPGSDAPEAVRRADARFYDRILALLSHKGLGKHVSMTPMEFARGLARTHRDFTDLPLFTSWFYDAQYGGRAIDRDQSRRLHQFMQKLRDDPAFGTR